MKNQNGESTLSTVVAIFLAAVLMFLFPLVAIGQKNDDAASMFVHEQLQNFVDNGALKGKITMNDLEKMKASIAATNNSYDYEIKVRISDLNPAIKSSTQNQGDASYYTIFTDQFMSELNAKGVFVFKEGDYISIKAVNTNTTIAQSIRNVLYGIMGKNDSAISQQASAYVTVTGNN